MKHSALLTALVAIAMMCTLTANAQDQMVVVTADGDLQVYPVADMSNFSYDAATDSYSLASGERTLTFEGKGIKQIYFADKCETDNDPYIIPKSTDTLNPNYVRPEVDSYEIVEMDTTLCRVRVRFLKDKPSLYVGKVLSLDYEEHPYNCYVLTSHENNGVVDIRYRNALLRELIYNTNFVLTDNADDLYFPNSAQAIRAQRAGTNRRGNVDSELKPIKLATQAYDFFKSSELKFGSQVSNTFGCELTCNLGDPVPGTESIRSYMSEVKYFGLVFRGNYEKKSTVKVNINGKYSLSHNKILTKHPFFTQGMVTIGAVPFWLIVTADFGAQIEAAIERNFRYAHTQTDQLFATIGFEYRGEEDHLTPIFDIKPYVAYADCHEGVRSGFVDANPIRRLDVVIPDEVAALFSEEETVTLRKVLELDPRPHYHNDPQKVYGMPFAGRDVKFCVIDGLCKVLSAR